ncbi:hypothetical protein AMJ39_05665, partial [candidate division TA06 bacterium DG_24]
MDGYDDVVITAFDAGPGMTGEAYVYFGGSPMDTLVDLYLDPGGSHDAFGLGVCAGEDVNGDGYPDIVVGDAHWLSGRAYLYFGGPSLDNVADLVLEGEGSNAHFGIGLAMGDLNADGAAEVIAGATRWCPPNSIANGRAYVYYGGEMLDDIPDVIVTGQTQGQRLGGGVLATTDLNLDGYRDLCIWAQYPERFLFHAGEGWMDRVEEAVVVSPGPWNDWFGSGFAAFGVDDLTGDSLPDLVIGACGVDVDRLQNAGMVYVYSFFHGPVEIRAVPRTPEVHPGERLRYAVGATNTTWRVQTFEVWSGALMPDGFLYEGNPIWGPLERTLAAQDTVVVQLNQRIPPGHATRAVHVDSSRGGGVSGHSVEQQQLRVQGGGAMMSTRVLLVIALVLALAVTCRVSAEVPELMLTLTRHEGYEEFGYDVANVGDVNGDGAADLVVGAGRSLEGFGRGYLYLGGAAFDTIPDVVFTGEQRNEAYAKSLAGAGDLNGDGFQDILIGARSNDEAGPGAGKAYIYFGAEVMDSLPDVELHGQSGDVMGRALAGCGDVN